MVQLGAYVLTWKTMLNACLFFVSSILFSTQTSTNLFNDCGRTLSITPVDLLLSAVFFVSNDFNYRFWYFFLRGFHPTERILWDIFLRDKSILPLKSIRIYLYIYLCSIKKNVLIHDKSLINKFIFNSDYIFSIVSFCWNFFSCFIL